MLFVQREEPTAVLVKHLLNRESKSGDNFTVSLLIQWAQNEKNFEKLADLIGNFVSTKISPVKRKRFVFLMFSTCFLAKVSLFSGRKTPQRNLK